MPEYAHPTPKRLPRRKRCKTKHSRATPALCKLKRGHEGDHLFGWWPPAQFARYYTRSVDLDAKLPPIIGAVAAGDE